MIVRIIKVDTVTAAADGDDVKTQTLESAALSYAAAALVAYDARKAYAAAVLSAKAYAKTNTETNAAEAKAKAKLAALHENWARALYADAVRSQKINAEIG